MVCDFEQIYIALDTNVIALKQLQIIYLEKEVNFPFQLKL